MSTSGGTLTKQDLEQSNVRLIGRGCLRVVVACGDDVLDGRKAQTAKGTQLANACGELLRDRPNNHGAAAQLQDQAVRNRKIGTVVRSASGPVVQRRARAVVVGGGIILTRAQVLARLTGAISAGAEGSKEAGGARAVVAGGGVPVARPAVEARVGAHIARMILAQLSVEAGRARAVEAVVHIVHTGRAIETRIIVRGAIR